MATEDYLEKSLTFKIRKALRYVELYGIRRTLGKIRGQYHMVSKKTFEGERWQNPACKSTSSQTKTIGILGCGSFAYSAIAYYLAQGDKTCLRAAMDIAPARARSLVSRYDGAYATTDPMAIINDPAIDLIFIASNHATHAPYAVEAIKAGKNVHIEKPHVVTAEQLEELEAAMASRPEVMVFLGFNRPKSQLFTRLREVLSEESGPIMINWFVAGHAIEDDHWYFKSSEGGRILGNLCHWSDLTLELVDVQNRLPCRIVPTSPRGAKSDFVTAIEFADGSLAAITFSAKGHTFEGVREVLNLHKGNVLAEIKDFKTLSVSRGAVRQVFNSRHRDHGHGANIINSFRGVREKDATRQSDRNHIVTTAKLFLAIREAHESRCPVDLLP